jgi:hypothetical protein
MGCATSSTSRTIAACRPGKSCAKRTSGCDQENLIEQLKNGVRALHAPVNTLNANWAYMIMAALAWTLLLPVNPRWRELHEADRAALLRMDFRTLYNAVIRIPCQIVRVARTPWARLVFRLQDAM